MGTYRAKKRGCLKVDGVPVPFDKDLNVSALADLIPAAVLRGLVAASIWEDVTVEIKESEKKMEEQIKAVDKARKAKKK